MRFSFIALAAMLALSGCSQKGAFGLFTMDEAHERAVEQLRSDRIVLSMETKAILTAVYLNPVYPEEYKDGEYFIGAFYFDKRNLDVKKWTLADHGYTLRLNGTAPVSMEEIKEKDPRRTLIPVQNNWYRYYLIRFDTVSAPNLSLRLENNQTGSVVLSYQKAQ
jgi:hypothetical protein